jgi:serine protease
MSQERANGRRRNLVWLLVIAAVLLVWLLWRPPGSSHHPTASDESDVIASEIIVDFSDADSDARVAEVAQKLGIELRLVSHQARNERLYRAHVEPARRDEILAQLAALPDVEVAEPDAEVHLFGAGAGAQWEGYPNDPQYKYQWHFGQIGMPEAWKLADGEGVVVAVIDTGVAYENWGDFHRVPDLAGAKFVKPYNFVDDNDHADDDHGHGTHVSGTIAQTTNNGIGVAGIAHHATIMPLKVLSRAGSGSVAAIADAIHYAADNGAKVINMSLGGRFRSRVLEKAVKYAHDKGVVVVCAAGNDSAHRVSYPAAYPGAVAVAATQFDETTTFYSNYGKEIDVAAPGGNTQVDQNNDGMPDGVLQNTINPANIREDGYFPFMGTSMASPHVAGVAALVIQQGVTDPDAVEKVLKDTARKPNTKSGKMDKERYGAGIIDAPAAVKKARAATGGWELGLGLVLAGALAASARRRGAMLPSSPGYLAGVLVGASGLFFLPYLGGIGESLASLPVLSTFTRGFPSWDLAVFGPAGHGNLLFFSALVPLLAVALGYGKRKLRPVLAGFCVGVAAHLGFQLLAHTVDVSPVWLGANAVLSAALALGVLQD